MGKGDGFNNRHPECKIEEAFFKNVDGDAGWNAIRFSSKRRGEKAYDSEGTPLPPGITPVFADKVELLANAVANGGI